MKKYWLSWYHSTAELGMFKLSWPVWNVGQDGESDSEIMRAAVKAKNEEAAMHIIVSSYDDIMAGDIEFIFVDEKPVDWSPFSDRFPKASWMKWE